MDTTALGIRVCYKLAVHVCVEVNCAFGMYRWGFLDIVKILIEEHHVDPNCRDSKGLTPLHWACRSVQLCIISLTLLSLGGGGGGGVQDCVV